MRYLEFREKMKGFPLFETKELRLILGADFSPGMLVNLKNWVSKRYIIMLRRGLYVFREEALGTDLAFFSGKLYVPSYVSMESALSYYGIIPEAVFTVTSVTTRKTKEFTNELGRFTYQKIKKETFGGYEMRSMHGLSFALAVPEKAIADFLYLNRNRLTGENEEYEGYRFNEDFEFDKKKLVSFARAFDNAKTTLLINRFIKRYVAR